MLFVNRVLIIPVAAVNAHRDDDWNMFPLIGTDSWNMYAHGVQYSKQMSVLPDGYLR